MRLPRLIVCTAGGFGFFVLLLGHLVFRAWLLIAAVRLFVQHRDAHCSKIILFLRRRWLGAFLPFSSRALRSSAIFLRASSARFFSASCCCLAACSALCVAVSVMGINSCSRKMFWLALRQPVVIPYHVTPPTYATVPGRRIVQLTGRMRRSAKLSVWNMDLTGAATTPGVPTVPMSAGVVSSRCSVA